MLKVNSTEDNSMQMKINAGELMVGAARRLGIPNRCMNSINALNLVKF